MVLYEFYKHIEIFDYKDEDWKKVEEDNIENNRLCDFCEKKQAQWTRSCVCFVKYRTVDCEMSSKGCLVIAWCDDCKGKKIKKDPCSYTHYKYIDISRYTETDWNKLDYSRLCDFCFEKPAQWIRKCIAFVEDKDGGTCAGDFHIVWCDDCKGETAKGVYSRACEKSDVEVVARFYKIEKNEVRPGIMEILVPSLT